MRPPYTFVDISNARSHNLRIPNTFFTVLTLRLLFACPPKSILTSPHYRILSIYLPCQYGLPRYWSHGYTDPGGACAAAKERIQWRLREIAGRSRKLADALRRNRSWPNRSWQLKAALISVR